MPTFSQEKQPLLFSSGIQITYDLITITIIQGFQSHLKNQSLMLVESFFPRTIEQSTLAKTFCMSQVREVPRVQHLNTCICYRHITYRYPVTLLLINV